MMLLVGPALQAELGGVGFLALYLAGGVLANLVAYAWNCSWRRRRRWTFQVGRFPGAPPPPPPSDCAGGPSNRVYRDHNLVLAPGVRG